MRELVRASGILQNGVLPYAVTTSSRCGQRLGAALGTFADGSAPCKKIMKLQPDHNRITVGSQSGHSRVTVGSQSGHSRVIGFFMILARDEEKSNLILIKYTTAISKSQNHKETYDPTVTRL